MTSALSVMRRVKMMMTSKIYEQRNKKIQRGNQEAQKACC